ncbi:MAG: M28 family peptidase [Myxococcota bacterium]
MPPKGHHRKVYTPPVRALSPVEVAADADPMTHIEVLASDAMRGRDSPSPELDKAAAYISAFAQKYGLIGPNAADPQGPYYQTFSMFAYPSSPFERSPYGGDLGNPVPPRPRLFERGFFLDSTTKQEDLDVVAERLSERFPGGVPLRTPLKLVGDAATRARILAKLAKELPLAGQVQNVVGLLPGDGPHKDEVIVVMAHYDHIGARGTRIYNGADDNASGSAVTMSMLPALAELKKQGKLDRSILFLWTAAEEKGLVGASYYVKHPLPKLGLKEIVGVVNVDMIGRLNAEQVSYIDSSNGERNYFHAVHDAANKGLANPFDHQNHDVDQYVRQQDGYAFTRAGEDVLFVYEGLTNLTGGGSENPDYHTTRDTIDAMKKDNGGTKARHISELVTRIVGLAANRP